MVVFIYWSIMIYYVYIEICVVSYIYIWCISTLHYVSHPSYLHRLVFPRVSFSDTAQLSMVKCVDTVVHATCVRTTTRRTREHPSARGGLLGNSRIHIEAKQGAIDTAQSVNDTSSDRSSRHRDCNPTSPCDGVISRSRAREGVERSNEAR